MLHYEFPKIKHLDDVRPAIEGRDEFIVAERDWGYVVNYMVNMPDTFPQVVVDGVYDLHAAIRRECRGMLFYKDGSLMSRRLHKFFNVNERDETQENQIDWSAPHVILEKLDGSMITPVFTAAGIRWGTKMGITDVSMGAELFVANHVNYERAAKAMQDLDKTMVFEWCSRKQRIVIDYPTDRLVLIAIRNNVNGSYDSYETMQAVAAEYDLDIVRAYEGTAANMAMLIAETRETEGMEGWIIRFDNGQMLKVKGDWYCRIHKTKDNITMEKNVIDLIVNEKLDDTKSFMLEEDRHRVEQFEAEFWSGFNQSVHSYERYFNTVVASGLDRKRYALEWKPTIEKNDPVAPQIVFGCFQGRKVSDMLLDIIRKNCNTQTKVDAVRHLWGGYAWSYHFEGDN